MGQLHLPGKDFLKKIYWWK